VCSGEKNAEKRKYAAEGNTAGPDPNVTGGVEILLFVDSRGRKIIIP
jgi:hypothetical protein